MAFLGCDPKLHIAKCLIHLQLVCDSSKNSILFVLHAAQQTSGFELLPIGIGSVIVLLRSRWSSHTKPYANGMYESEKREKSIYIFLRRFEDTWSMRETPENSELEVQVTYSPAVFT